mmetsp:Transcript_33132/g.84109  ORF Transcript_33132/g.84109 Transcript_33132/m.84109 type:complete len:203 (+) Transcript_33132:3967-4575(+)
MPGLNSSTSLSPAWLMAKPCATAGAGAGGADAAEPPYQLPAPVPVGSVEAAAFSCELGGLAPTGGAAAVPAAPAGAPALAEPPVPTIFFSLNLFSSVWGLLTCLSPDAGAAGAGAEPDAGLLPANEPGLGEVGAGGSLGSSEEERASPLLDPTLFAPSDGRLGGPVAPLLLPPAADSARLGRGADCPVGGSPDPDVDMTAVR